MLITDFSNAAPEVYRALGAISRAAAEAGLERELLELVKIRASQINACAYCLGFHTQQARKLGVPQGKLDLLPVWRDSPLFSDRERAALAWTESLVLMAQTHPGGQERAAAATAFGEREFLHLTVAIGLINQWNRICGGLGVQPPEAEAV
jgi:AhpD family alkylhydroperoxidase